MKMNVLGTEWSFHVVQDYQTGVTWFDRLTETICIHNVFLRFIYLFGFGLAFKK